MTPPLALLAGGLATRLYPATRTIPKALLEVAGEPFIKHQLALLKRRGVTKIVICAGYLGSQIQDCLGDGKEIGLAIAYSFDGDRLLGTGGALRKALPLLGDLFWVMYGDSYLDLDFGPILQFFLTRDKLGLMTVFKNENRWDRSNVLYAKGKIVRYDKRNPAPDMKHIDYGLALLRKKALETINQNVVFDLSDLYQQLVEKDELLGYEAKERFYEIGSFAGLRETSDYLLRIKQKGGREDGQ